MDKNEATTIDEYISKYPESVQERLQKLRATVLKAAPKAEQTIKYGMPTFMLNGNLVYFAVAKKHIGVYPIPGTGSAKFNADIAPYRAAKSAMQLPFDKPVPYGLVGQLVKLRVKENAERAKARDAKTTKQTKPAKKASGIKK